MSFPLGASEKLSLALSIIDDYSIKGEQVSEETTSMERAQTNSGLFSQSQ
jgi:hypothetical protein